MSYFRTAILLAALTALFMGIGYLIGGQAGMVIALLVAGGMNLFAYWNSDKMVLSMYGAREVDARSAPELYALVQQLAAAAGLPMPRVYVMENPQPNAFATGRNPEHAAVAVTTGLLNTVSHEELAGVIAHELGHVKNRDTLLMTITATIAGAVSMLANFGFVFGGRGNNNGNIGIVGTLDAGDPRPARRGAGADGDQPHARIRGRQGRRRDQPASAVARLGPAKNRRRRASTSPTCRPSAIPPRRICSSSIRCPGRAWTICSRPTPMSRTGWRGCRRWRATWARPALRRPARRTRGRGPSSGAWPDAGRGAKPVLARLRRVSRAR